MHLKLIFRILFIIQKKKLLRNLINNLSEIQYFIPLSYKIV